MILEISEIYAWFADKDYSKNTQDRYERALLQLTSEIPDLENITPAILKRWLQNRNWGLSTQWVTANAVKGFCRWKYGDDHPVLSLKVKRPIPPPVRTLTFEECVTLMRSFSRATPKGCRDLAMCSLFLDTGLRVAEMCRLELKYLDLDDRTLRVIVKGGDWNTRYFSEETAKFLKWWLVTRAGFAKHGVKTVFVSVGGDTLGEPMTRYGVQTIVNYWGKKAGIGHISPHTFRRTYATLATRLGGPQKIVMKGGGWKDDRVFSLYTRDIRAEDMEPYLPVAAIEQQSLV
jgi:integrase